MSSLAIRRASPANPVNANVTSAQVFALTSNPLAPVTVALPGKLVLEAKRFTVRAEGWVVTGTTTNVTATLIAGLTIPGTPFTIGNWTTLGASTARAVNTASCPWFIQADLIFDSVSGKLQGVFSDLINNLWDAPAVLSNVLTGINGLNVISGSTAPADPVAFIGVALTFSAANVGNVGNLANFELGF